VTEYQLLLLLLLLLLMMMMMMILMLEREARLKQTFATSPTSSHAGPVHEI